MQGVDKWIFNYLFFSILPLLSSSVISSMLILFLPFMLGFFPLSLDWLWFCLLFFFLVLLNGRKMTITYSLISHNTSKFLCFSVVFFQEVEVTVGQDPEYLRDWFQLNTGSHEENAVSVWIFSLDLITCIETCLILWIMFAFFLR